MNQLKSKYETFDLKFLNPKLFVIMPMPSNREGAHFFKIKEAIYSAASKVGFSAVRQDDKKYDQEAIYESIKKSIEEAIICIADLTNSRPNCYFEIGFAFGKKDSDKKIPKVILLIEKGQKVEFDLSGIEVTEYVYSQNNYLDIETNVLNKLRKFIENHIFMTSKIEKVYEKAFSIND